VQHFSGQPLSAGRRADNTVRPKRQDSRELLSHGDKRGKSGFDAFRRRLPGCSSRLLASTLLINPLRRSICRLPHGTQRISSNSGGTFVSDLLPTYDRAQCSEESRPVARRQRSRLLLRQGVFSGFGDVDPQHLVGGPSLSRTSAAEIMRLTKIITRRDISAVRDSAPSRQGRGRELFGQAVHERGLVSAA
jgi:hypothetical protein